MSWCVGSLWSLLVDAAIRKFTRKGFDRLGKVDDITMVVTGRFLKVLKVKT